MSDTCNVCGRYYLNYQDGHTPNSTTCLSNQLNDAKARVVRQNCEIAQLQRDKAALEAACRKAIEDEPELPGPIPPVLIAHLLADPERILRATVIATKRGIMDRMGDIVSKGALTTMLKPTIELLDIIYLSISTTSTAEIKRAYMARQLELQPPILNELTRLKELTK